jgi:hypothetical protein
MRPFRLCVILTLSASVVGLSAQNAATTNPTPAVSSTAKTPKPPNPAGSPAPPKATTPKYYFLEVHVLKTPAFAAPNGCYTKPLQFPATNADQVAKEIVKKDYSFTSLSPDRIAINYKNSTPPPAPELKTIRDQLNELALSEYRHAESISVSRGSATKTLKQLDLEPDGPMSGAVVDNRDSCILLVTRAETPDPVVMASLQANLPQVYWRAENTPPIQRLFHLDATAAVKKLSAAPDSGSESPSGAGADSEPKAKPSTASSSKLAAAPASKAGSTSAKNPAQNAAAKPIADASPTTAGAGDAPDSTDSGSAPNKASAGRNPDSSDKNAPAPAKPLDMKAVNDMLVYSNEDGSDRGFFERNRLMTVLDLPRPEVLMNIWSLQVSTKDPKMASMEADSSDELISHHNEALENAIEQGWDFLSQKMSAKDFFEPGFYNYITKKFAETRTYVDAPEAKQPETRNNGHDSGVAIDSDRTRWGWCDPNLYCLGFIHAFEPLRPTLTNLLLTMMAAKDSQGMTKAIDIMECPHHQFDEAGLSCSAPKTDSCKPGAKSNDSCSDNGVVNRFDKCVNEELKRLHTLRQQSAMEDCELTDRMTLIGQINSRHEEGLQLECFKDQAKESFGPASDQQDKFAATRVGLLRAAVADFLFNYKWSTEYPHDFIPYDLTQSAQELNAEFNPLVLAFNRDVKAFTQNLETELQCKHEANSPNRLNAAAWIGKGDETFLNDGMISVRGISGVESIVDTVTQSFFDATTPPNLTDLVKSVSDAEKNVPGVLKANLSADEAAVLLGALNSVQPAESKIGRELKLDITPHTLAGASSAEREVKLTADESSNPTLFKADKQTEDTISRVAKHDTNTRVRVESLKLFDVSSFSAMLQRPRSKFPIVPPFFEVPYFGSFVGLPLPGAKVYHRSTAIVSAIIVPTAADLAFGIEFSNGRICEPGDNPNQASYCHSARSPRDFGALPLRSFNKAMVLCFASGGRTFYAGQLSESLATTAPKDSTCANLSLVKSADTTNPQGDVSVPPNF